MPLSIAISAVHITGDTKKPALVKNLVKWATSRCTQFSGAIIIPNPSAINPDRKIPIVPVRDIDKSNTKSINEGENNKDKKLIPKDIVLNVEPESENTDDNIDAFLDGIKTNN